MLRDQGIGPLSEFIDGEDALGRREVVQDNTGTTTYVYDGVGRNTTVTSGADAR
ncbi:MAG TPA: hypothetical protein QGH10_13275 [Armatimonadota bacterium]|nr:hypothetical protein [Armatimonadota bacterium]